MRPIMLIGHERALTQVKFNREGDLIFTVSKDKVASVWYSFNGERLGTLEGHSGTIWSVDCSADTRLALTGSADCSAKLWDVQTGECLFTWNMNTPVRRVEFHPTKDEILMVTDQVMGHKGAIFTFPINRQNLKNQTNTATIEVPTLEGFDKALVVGYSYLGKYIIGGHVNGTISKFDGATGELVERLDGVHTGQITDLQFSADKMYFVTSSKDKSAKILDVDSLKVLKNFETDAPVNSATITPVKDFVILGGGQDAKDVTTTSARQGKFEARFFHKVFGDEIGRVAGHFGPLNYVAIHPNGTTYASGAEDGIVRVHHFDKSYFDFKYDVELTAGSSIA